MAKSKAKRIDDEKDKHPFYSDWGRKQFSKHKKELEILEKELGKRRKSNNDGILQETAPEENRESEH